MFIAYFHSPASLGNSTAAEFLYHQLKIIRKCARGDNFYLRQFEWSFFLHQVIWQIIDHMNFLHLAFSAVSYCPHRFGVVATVVILLLGIPFSLISMLIDPWLLAYFSQPTAICIDYQHNNTFSGPYAKNVFYQDFVTHRCSNSDPSAFPTTCHCTFAPMEANPPCWNFTSTVIEPIAVSKNCEVGFFQGFLPAYTVVTIFEALGALSASILLVVCCISLCCPVYVVSICVEKHQHQQQQPETFADDGNRRLEVMPVRSNTTTHNPISTSREGTNVEASRRDLTDDVEMVLLRYSS